MFAKPNFSSFSEFSIYTIPTGLNQQIRNSNESTE